MCVLDSEPSAGLDSERDGVHINAPDAKITIDSTGVITSFNYVAERIFGISAEMAIERSFQSLFQDQLPDLAELHDDNRKESSREFEGLRNDGSVFCAEITTRTLQSDNCLTMVATVRDRTYRKMFESHLSRSQTMESIGTLSAGIAHEVNTPIQFIGENIKFVQNAMTELGALLELYDQLTARVRNNEEASDLVERIDEERDIIELDELIAESDAALVQSWEGTRKIAEIVAALRDISASRDTKKSLLDVDELIEEALVLARHEYKYATNIQKDFQTPMPKCFAHRSELLSSILGLLMNSIHAVDQQRNKQEIEKGEITFQTSANDEWIEIKIGDNGCGIPDEDKPKIFDPFFTTKPNGVGSGLGLAVVHSVIVEKHHGKVLCDSTVNKGTSFTIRLPRQK